MKILVVNHAHSKVCGIHDLGLRIHHQLQQSTVIESNHLDIGDIDDWRTALAVVEPDVVIVNYRPDLMPWIPTALSEPRSAIAYAVMHQYEEATADDRARAILAAGFNYVLALDPGLTPTETRLHAVGRPIPHESTNVIVTMFPRSLSTCPTIGSFGFAFPHKGFPAVAAEIVDQCHRVSFTLHMPEAHFNGAEGNPLYAPGILAACCESLAKAPQFDWYYGSEHLEGDELVFRLSLNDVNCLFYVPGQPDAGLSSAVDYLIAARRPMLLTDCAMFRHAWNAPRFPDVRLGDILNNYGEWQAKADELYEWHSGRFLADVERIVSEL